MIEIRVLRIDEKGPNCGILAGYGGLKNASSSGTMDTGIELRI